MTHTQGAGAGRVASSGGSPEPGIGEDEAPKYVETQPHQALAAGALSRQDTPEPLRRPHLARGPQRRSAPLPRGEMKIIIISKTFRFGPQSTFPGTYCERRP